MCIQNNAFANSFLIFWFVALVLLCFGTTDRQEKTARKRLSACPHASFLDTPHARPHNTHTIQGHKSHTSTGTRRRRKCCRQAGRPSVKACGAHHTVTPARPSEASFSVSPGGSSRKQRQRRDDDSSTHKQEDACSHRARQCYWLVCPSRGLPAA